MRQEQEDNGNMKGTKKRRQQSIWINNSDASAELAEPKQREDSDFNTPMCEMGLKLDVLTKYRPLCQI